jgi:ribosomal protein L37AE/L43A
MESRIGKAPKQDCYGERPVCPVCGISTHQRIVFEHVALDEIQCQKCKTIYHW